MVVTCRLTWWTLRVIETKCSNGQGTSKEYVEENWGKRWFGQYWRKRSKVIWCGEVLLAAYVSLGIKGKLVGGADAVSIVLS